MACKTTIHQKSFRLLVIALSRSVNPDTARRGLLVLGAGESTLRLSPPLVIDKAQADFALEVLAACLQSV